VSASLDLLDRQQRQHLQRPMIQLPAVVGAQAVILSDHHP
jgi:hypothetical protein